MMFLIPKYAILDYKQMLILAFDLTARNLS